MMKVTGYQIREAVRRWTTKQAISAKMFPETLFAFSSDGKESPGELDIQFWNASRAIAMLQEIQQSYNSSIYIEVEGERMTLSRAIKLVAFAGQRAKAWKTAAAENGRGRFSDMAMTRSKEDEVATRQVSVKECLKTQEAIDSYLGNLRTAIAVANGKELDIEVPQWLIGIGEVVGS